MSDTPDDFYIGYLPQAPAPNTRRVRPLVAAALGGSLLLGAGLAVTLPYFGNGEFAFGEIHDYRGIVRGGSTPRLLTSQGDFPLVGWGKRSVPVELCGAGGDEILVRGTRITRDGRTLVEVAGYETLRRALVPTPGEESLGRFTLTGEIVDAKCYFGVMNPGEGRLHRACTIQCLRGGLPAAFAARDTTGATVQLLVSDAQGRALNHRLLPWAGIPVSASGEVVRQGEWLVFRLDPVSIRAI